MKKVMFVLALFIILFNFASANSIEQIQVKEQQLKEQLVKEQQAKVENAISQAVKSQDCVSFSATLSCGISVWVTACNASTSEIIGAILIADVVMCNFNVDEVLLFFKFLKLNGSKILLGPYYLL
ncbi:MAG: hypothetical protein RMJ97_03460 [Raineya sp.]|nr:hypothetical protein [Raineya sp.]